MHHLQTISFSDYNWSVIGGRIYQAVSGSGTARREDFEFHRSILTDFPSPRVPAFKDPRNSDDYGIVKAVNAIALLQSLFLGGKSRDNLRI
jgi:hypothetical protein